MLSVSTLYDVDSRVLVNGEGKRSKVPVHAMKAYRGNMCIAPFILNLDTPGQFTHGK
jgi:hypothetical protein